MSSMTIRERFNKALHWEKPDRVPNMDFGYWDRTLEVWHEQGLPPHVRDNQEAERHFGLEGTSLITTLPVETGLFPLFEYKVLDEKGEYKVIQAEDGVICKISDRFTSIPEYLKYPIESREDWERFKRERLDYTREDRIGDVQGAAKAAREEGRPTRFVAGSLYGLLRNWMGVENISIALMTEREWVEEMMEHLIEMSLYLIEKTLGPVEADMAWWWEDMCYNRGPLLSPKLFEELMVPRYRRITDALSRFGVDVNILDCDGCIYELVPGWLEAGINCMFPIEVLHTDPLVLRQAYGKDVLLMGGVNKIALAQGKKSIDLEMEKLRPLVEMGGFIPTVDHRVPPDVSLENYLYYLEKKKEIL